MRAVTPDEFPVRPLAPPPSCVRHPSGAPAIDGAAPPLASALPPTAASAPLRGARHPDAHCRSIIPARSPLR